MRTHYGLCPLPVDASMAPCTSSQCTGTAHKPPSAPIAERSPWTSHGIPLQAPASVSPPSIGFYRQRAAGSAPQFANGSIRMDSDASHLLHSSNTFVRNTVRASSLSRTLGTRYVSRHSSLSHWPRTTVVLNGVYPCVPVCRSLSLLNSP